MRITDLLDVRSISLTGNPKTKNEALDQIVDLMVKSGKINDREAYRKQVYAREEESTTGVGDGIAIPHGKCDAVDKPGLAAMVIKDGVPFDALDGKPVTLMFLIAAPNTKDNVHLDVLSKLSVLMMDENFANNLRNAKTAEEFLAIIDKADKEESGIDERLADTNAPAENNFKILAVTSCPTGIAHTYMAAEGLEKAAKAKNCFIKVETRGSGGAKNVLTPDEIRDADCVIVAADAQVPMDRFDGKKVIICQVSDGISKADQLVDQAMSGNVPVYHGAGEHTEASAGANKSGGIGHQIYTQLMNGVSHMLPFVVGGGILIAIAFLLAGADFFGLAKASEVMLDLPSVGATENLMMTCVFLDGTSVIRNCAKEPEIVDLQNFLNAMGAKVSGAGTGVIRVNGVKRLFGVEYTPIPDRIVAGTYLIGAAMCGGELTLNNVNPEHISSLIAKLPKSTCKITCARDKINIICKGRCESIPKVETTYYPGFPTDLQTQILTLQTVSDGTSVIVENIFETRFKTVPQLLKMGADVTVNGRTAVVRGVPCLTGAEVCATDLRGGASLVLAGMCAQGETVVDNVFHIDRGYENLAEILPSLGVKIKRI